MKKKPVPYLLYRSLWSLLDLLFPPKCAGCGGSGSRWCAACQAGTVTLSPVNCCQICGLPEPAPGICKTCREDPPQFRALRAWAVFDDPIRGALHALKYRCDMSMGDALAAQMLPFVEELGWQFDALVPIPLGKQRLKERGYNQVGMIAKPLALALNMEYAPRALTRRKETRSQVGLSKHERKENIGGAFEAADFVRGRTMLLMDDVATTGSTLSAAAQALSAAGAREVYALTVARALPQHGLTRA